MYLFFPIDETGILATSSTHNSFGHLGEKAQVKKNDMTNPAKLKPLSR